MFKGEKGFFTLLVICCLVAVGVFAALRPSFPNLPTNQDVETGESKYSPGSPACYPSRIAGLPDGEAADEAYRCATRAEQEREQGKDLVQQTRAADAAVAEVGLSYRALLISLVGSIFGFLTLLAAAYAAWYARRAAEAGHTANRIAERAQRPWLKLKLTRIEVQGSAIQLTATFKYKIAVKNLSSTPALMGIPQIEGMGAEGAYQPFADRLKNSLDVPTLKTLIPPNGEIPMSEMSLTLPNPPQVLALNMKRVETPLLVGIPYEAPGMEGRFVSILEIEARLLLDGKPREIEFDLTNEVLS